MKKQAIFMLITFLSINASWMIQSYQNPLRSEISKLETFTYNGYVYTVVENRSNESNEETPRVSIQRGSQPTVMTYLAATTLIALGFVSMFF